MQSYRHPAPLALTVLFATTYLRTINYFPLINYKHVVWNFMYLPVCCLLFQKEFWGWDICKYVLGGKRYMKKFRGMDI